MFRIGLGRTSIRKVSPSWASVPRTLPGYSVIFEGIPNNPVASGLAGDYVRRGFFIEYVSNGHCTDIILHVMSRPVQDPDNLYPS